MYPSLSTSFSSPSLPTFLSLLPPICSLAQVGADIQLDEARQLLADMMSGSLPLLHAQHAHAHFKHTRLLILLCCFLLVGRLSVAASRHMMATEKP